MIYDFKGIKPIPPAKEFADIVLSRTQRKTPTVIHPTFQISRIRLFYMRKVKFTQDSINEKLDSILEGFPKLDGIHPFYADLLNVLYDRDHYKLALGQIAAVKKVVDSIARDYTRLMKFADSLYRCKQLKRAALGRMITLIMKQKDSLIYLEQVRMHLGRLPSIDPYTRTLIICGYPNVGKSSFINKITKANVDVQPYSFTTKSLYVGHLDYRYLRWQVIDTPGILDHPFEERNTIEMLSITALAHLNSCILYFMDLSGECGYTVEAQCKLFHSIKPLFSGKPILLVINKIDIMNIDGLDEDGRKLIGEIIKDGVEIVTLSCLTDRNIMEVRSKACDLLLLDRIDKKLRGNKIESVKSMLHISEPMRHDDIQRPPYVPQAALQKKKYDKNDATRPKLERDLEKENGGCGVYNIDLNKGYILKNKEWIYDAIPEVIDGKNVADLIDPEIETKLAALEQEEESLISSGYYDILNSSISRETSKMKYMSNPKKTSMIPNKVLVARLKRQESSSADAMDTYSNTHAPSPKLPAPRRNSVLQHVHTLRGLRTGGKINRMSIVTKRPKYLFSGKRKVGKADRR